jgi:cytochrome bd-type quinol oxidase subunit 2
MLPRAHRPHDQLLSSRAIWVAAIGGLVVGHILWLAGISIAIATQSVSSWVLIVASVSIVSGAVAAYYGWRSYRRKSEIWAAFLWALPVSPVLLSLTVLGVTYL